MTDVNVAFSLATGERVNDDAITNRWVKDRTAAHFKVRNTVLLCDRVKEAPETNASDILENRAA